jgi:hypothetical protein
MVKIKSIQKLPEKNRFGLWSYTITLEDGKRCYFYTKEDNQTTFTEGMETDAIVEEKQKADGTGVYYTIKPNRPAFGGGKGGYSKDHKKEAVTMCLSYAKDLCVAGKISTEQMLPLATKFHEWVTSKLD